MRREAETRGTRAQAKDHPRLPDAGRGRRDPPPEPSEAGQAGNTDFRLPASGTSPGEPCCVKAPVRLGCCSSPRKVVRGPSRAPGGWARSKKWMLGVHGLDPHLPGAESLPTRRPWDDCLCILVGTGGLGGHGAGFRAPCGVAPAPEPPRVSAAAPPGLPCAQSCFPAAVRSENAPQRTPCAPLLASRSGSPEPTHNGGYFHPRRKGCIIS